MSKQNTVQKVNLIEHMAEEAGISKAAAGRALDALLKKTTDTLKDGGSVQIIGFGTFTSSARAARLGVNPRTSEKIKIAARKTPKFTAGATLKAAIN